MINKLRTLIPVIAVILAASGCGGGGSSDAGGGGGGSDTVSLSWTAPTTDANGGTLTDLAGYKIYVGTTSGTYTSTFDVGNVTTYTVTSLTAGTTYYAVATAYNDVGFESEYSNEVSKTP